jgi:tetratricopeptide (TPR) repeat protein
MSRGPSRLGSSVGQRAADRGQRIGELRARIVEAILLVNLEPEGAIELLEAVTAEALPLFETAGDNVALLDAFDALVLIHSYPRDHDALLATAERALHNARTVGAAHREQALLQWLANALYYGTTPLDEFISWLNDQEAEGHHHPAFNAHRAEALACLGRFDESRATLAALSEEVHAPSATIPIAFTAAFSATVEAVAGDYAAAEAFARQACAILNASGERGWLARTLTELGQYLYALGRLDEAEDAARQGGEIGASDDIVTQLVSLQVRAKVLARHGATAEAERLAREAVALGARTDMLNLQAVAALDLAEVLELGGRPDAATDEVARALALFERKGNLVLANRTRIKLNELRAGTPSAPRAAAGVPIP